jgi:formylglycine-generating enzyme required for sulfatase activity
MKTKSVSNTRTLSSILLATGLAAGSSWADIGYQFVQVGNPGNANDIATGSLYGGVNYTYDIGKYDVTLNQYAAFLNAVATSDPDGLYTANLGTDIHVKGIAQNGVSGSFSYTVIGDGNRPVTFVSWLDAARMANWMQNGQPSGLGEVAASTEQGAYTLNGDTSSGLETKNANAVYWIPSENEWYKAAYYDPNKGGPGVGGYWTYATKSNTVPGNNATNPTLPNQANFNNGVYSVSQGSGLPNGNVLTDVGAFTNSASAYGTFDQSGLVNEWTDAINGSQRGVTGGAWNDPASNLIAAGPAFGSPGPGGTNGGFRLASVPEPTAAVSLVFACGLLMLRRRRF